MPEARPCGAIERGSVESIRAVLCFTDIRGWTSIADAHSGPALIDLLDEVFEHHRRAAAVARRGRC